MTPLCRQPHNENDPLAVFIAKAGGLNPDYAEGMRRGELRRIRELRRGLPPGTMNKKASLTLEEMATRVRAEGFTTSDEIDHFLELLEKDCNACAVQNHTARVYRVDSQAALDCWTAKEEEWSMIHDNNEEEEYIPPMEKQDIKGEKKAGFINWPTGEETIALLRKETDTVILSFSNGKDSLATWIVLRDAGFKIIPFYAQFVPKLGFIERSLNYYEDFFGTHIYRTIDSNFYHWLKTYGFQPPERMKTLTWLNMPRFEYSHIQAGIARTVGLDDERYWCAVGTRASDSLNRMLSFKHHGPVNLISRRFYPIYDKKKLDLIPIFKNAGVKLPPDYRLFGRSFCGLDFRFMSAIREHYPEDFEIIKFWFPLIELEFAKYEIGACHAI